MLLLPSFHEKSHRMRMKNTNWKFYWEWSFMLKWFESNNNKNHHAKIYQSMIVCLMTTISAFFLIMHNAVNGIAIYKVLSICCWHNLKKKQIKNSKLAKMHNVIQIKRVSTWRLKSKANKIIESFNLVGWFIESWWKTSISAGDEDFIWQICINLINSKYFPTPFT